MTTHARLALLGLLAIGFSLLVSSAGAGISTERVSVASDGTQANERSLWPAITPSGRYVAFQSYASNLVDGDSNGQGHVFVRDRYTHTTERVSVDSDGIQGNGASGGWGLAISSDGRYVAFSSSATNLVADDTNGKDDIFVHDRDTDTTERVSVDSAGSQADGLSGFLGIAMSEDGRYVAFDSYATNLVPDDTNGEVDLFLRDRDTDTTERVSVDSAGNEANGWSDVEAISRDGQHVAFASAATNLISDDSNGKTDIFIHDRDTHTTELLSVNSDGDPANGNSYFPAISGDLRYVAFLSEASDLVPDDTNGYDDVFLRDRATGATKLISVSSDGEQADDSSGVTLVAIGLDNRFVAYDSFATNLVPGDTNNSVDIFVDPPTADPVGGLAELPDVAGDSGSSAGTYAALAGGLAAALIALTAGAWYARRRWSR